MHTESSNYEAALRFFQIHLGKKLKPITFCKKTKNLKKPISGAFWSNITNPKIDSKFTQKVQITNLASVFSKSV